MPSSFIVLSFLDGRPRGSARTGNGSLAVSPTGQRGKAAVACAGCGDESLRVSAGPRGPHDPV